MAQALIWPAVDEEVLRTLPPVLRAIVKALGFGRASQFLNEYGGLNYAIPKIKTSALGLDEQELARIRIVLTPHMDHVGRVSLPKADKLFAHVRNEQILKTRSTQSISQQVREYKLSSRQVMNIRRALTKDERLHQSQIKRNLNFDATELAALKMLTEEKLFHSTANTIFLKILNKLNRASMQSANKNTGAQFDLFS